MLILHVFRGRCLQSPQSRNPSLFMKAALRSQPIPLSFQTQCWLLQASLFAFWGDCGGWGAASFCAPTPAWACGRGASLRTVRARRTSAVTFLERWGDWGWGTNPVASPFLRAAPPISRFSPISPSEESTSAGRTHSAWRNSKGSNRESEGPSCKDGVRGRVRRWTRCKRRAETYQRRWLPQVLQYKRRTHRSCRKLENIQSMS